MLSRRSRPTPEAEPYTRSQSESPKIDPAEAAAICLNPQHIPEDKPMPEAGAICPDPQRTPEATNKCAPGSQLNNKGSIGGVWRVAPFSTLTKESQGLPLVVASRHPTLFPPCFSAYLLADETSVFLSAFPKTIRAMKQYPADAEQHFTTPELYNPTLPVCAQTQTAGVGYGMFLFGGVCGGAMCTKFEMISMRE